MKFTRPIWILVLAGCLYMSIPISGFAEAAARYRVNIIDDPKEKRFIVVLKSLDDRSLCLGVGQWPNHVGQLDFGSSWVQLKSAAKSFRPRDTNFGYCPDCEIRVAPRKELKGFINYAEFGDPRAIAALPERQLHFPVVAWVCQKHRRK
jgi:hypothetical protein